MRKAFIEQMDLHGVSLRKAKAAILKIWTAGALNKVGPSYDFHVYDSKKTKDIWNTPDKDQDPAIAKAVQKDPTSIGSMIVLSTDGEDLTIIFQFCKIAEAKKIIPALLALIPED